MYCNCFIRSCIHLFAIIINNAYKLVPDCPIRQFYNRATLINCLSSFYPVRPRRQIVFPSREILGVKGPEDNVIKTTNFAPALFMTTPKLLTEQRVLINARIIVIGASSTGLAVLETLAGWYVQTGP